MPKVFVSIDIEDGVPFYTEEEEYRINEYYLAFHKHKLVIVMKSRGKSEVWSAEKLVYGPHEVSRECLKALVKSGRLLQFLNSVAGKLETMDEEYKEVSEIAEKMAKAIEG
jgi:transcriptional regulator NrdR family protein